MKIARIETYTVSAEWKSWLFIKGMLRISRGELPSNILNPEVLARTGFKTKLGRYAK